jgi:hypothetical protein
MDGLLIARNANRKPAHHVHLNEGTVNIAARLAWSPIAATQGAL